jgi:hypothetical protein
MGTVCMAASSSTWCAERTVGGGSANPPPFAFRKLVQRIRDEFDYFPDLRVSVCEAARFWYLDRATCQRVLSELLAAGFLIRDGDQRYSLAT